MERWVGRVALVTGGSMGIGAAIVQCLVKQGMKVAACARSLDKLQVCTQTYSFNALIPFTKQSKPMFNSRQII